MPEAIIVFWDVDHGHAAYLQSPNGRHIVIDLGTGSYGSNFEFSPLEHLKSQYGVTQLDYVIITHPHVDHIDDIFNFDVMSPKILLHPKHLDKKPILEKASNWGGLKIKSFVPTNCAQSNLNNHSAVATFSFEGLTVLVPGDNEPPSWHELKGIAGFLDITKDIDILLAPHHGRDSGFDSETMKHFNPRLTIVSDGAYCDTSATSRYTDISRGWTVYKKDGSSEKRYCLTTRNDGVISASFGKGTDCNTFLHVKIGQ